MTVRTKLSENLRRCRESRLDFPPFSRIFHARWKSAREEEGKFWRKKILAALERGETIKKQLFANKRTTSRTTLLRMVLRGSVFAPTAFPSLSPAESHVPLHLLYAVISILQRKAVHDFSFPSLARTLWTQDGIHDPCKTNKKHAGRESLKSLKTPLRWKMIENYLLQN